MATPILSFLFHTTIIITNVLTSYYVLFIRSPTYPKCSIVVEVTEKHCPCTILTEKAKPTRNKFQQPFNLFSTCKYDSMTDEISALGKYAFLIQVTG